MDSPFGGNTLQSLHFAVMYARIIHVSTRAINLRSASGSQHLTNAGHVNLTNAGHVNHTNYM